MTLTTAPLDAEHHAALIALLAAESRGCFCRFWHAPEDDLHWQGRCTVEPERNRRELEGRLAAGDDEAVGVVALDGDRLVGWLRVCPEPAMTKLRARRLYRDLDCLAQPRPDGWVVACVLVVPDARRAGVAGALVDEAIALVRARGGRFLRALPRRPRDPVIRDDELWLGPEACYATRGFVRIDDGPDPYPVLELEL